MSTEEERLQQRVARLNDNELVRTLFLFEHVESIDVSMRDMMATVFPSQQLPEPDMRALDMIGLLRGELRKRILVKSRGAS